MASGLVTKEIESRIKQTPEHIFEVFLEIQQPINNEAPEILIKYPNDYSDQILKTAPNFAYPCQTPSDEQSENFTFVVLDSTGLIFRYGYCRRSNKESTCLCIISYYPWFELFYNILNDLWNIINSKSEMDVEKYLSLLYNYKLKSLEDLYKNEGKELIEISMDTQGNYCYPRPDPRKLPSMLSNLNFTVMCSRLTSDMLLRLFAHLLFERRILFVSSKLFHLTACACASLDLINPMHWQSIFLPILPETLIWTPQCTAPYIIGIQSSIYSRMNKRELGDVIVINIDDRKIESPYDDLNLFPKTLIRQMKKDIEQALQLTGDHLARVFLRTMAFIIGNYPSGFVMKNEKLDFDREVYLQQYLGSDLYRFMSSVANTQMFEQFSRYRTYSQLEREIDIDEFDIEVKHLEQSKKIKVSKKPEKVIEKNASPVITQVQTVVNGNTSKINTNQQKTEVLLSDNKLSSSSTIADQSQTKSLIDFDTDEDPLLPAPVASSMTHALSTPPSARQTSQIDSKIKRLQTELQSKMQIYDSKRVDPRDDYGDEQKEIKKLVQQFDPLINSNVSFRSDLNPTDRHPSIYETIPKNYVNNVLKTLQTNSRMNNKPTSSDTNSNQSNLIDFN